LVGMYVHTHWGYRHPYAARTWSLHDWEGYLEGISQLGYDMVMVWPQLDCMPPYPTASDRAGLETIAGMIDIAHDRFDMRVAISVCANVMGNEKAASYTFRERPYFGCENRINPGSSAEVAAFLHDRGTQFELLRNADALVVIDSDPGGYVGSTNTEFVSLMKAQIDVFRSLNPGAELIYWMLAGWQSYNRFRAKVETDPSGGAQMWDDWQGDDFLETLTLMQEQISEPWSVLAWLKPHDEAIEALGIQGKTMAFPYGLVEGEPSFPLTSCSGARLACELVPQFLDRYPRGIMANAQTHCLQLANTYMFAHFARGDTQNTVDLSGFADSVMPGYGETVALAWTAIEKCDLEAERAAAELLRKAVGTEHRKGKLSGLLFGDADRFLVDLAMNLELRVALSDFKAAVADSREVVPSLRRVLRYLRPYQERVGFVDAYGGLLSEELNQNLARLVDPQLDSVLKLFTDWRDPSVRHGILLLLLGAMEAYCDTHS